MKKLTAKEILAIVKANYSEENFAYNEWSSLENKLEGFVPSEEVTRTENAKKAMWAEVQNHPGYNNRDLQDENYNALLSSYQALPNGYDVEEKEILNFLGLGEVEEVKQHGGEGEGDLWYSVKHFKDHDVYIRIDGFYSSYSGTDFHDGHGYEVKPQEKTITVYK